MKVNLWFARDEQNKIISIIDSNNENTYTCPICASKVIPKALESKKITPHYAHVDVDKCNSESMLHWWFKHKFIERGDTFKIKTDNEIEYTCKNFDTEVTFQLESNTYRPDLVIYTECGQEIVFEMANTNKKKVQDYIDNWIELDRIVVEVDIKALQSVDEIKVFNALYYNGKCFNFNKRDGGYYNTIGKLKEQMKQEGKYDIKLAKKLDWFWTELNNYRSDANNNDIFYCINSFIGNGYIYDLLFKIINTHKIEGFIQNYKIYLNEDIKRRISECTKLDVKSSLITKYQNIEIFPREFTLEANNYSCVTQCISIKDFYVNNEIFYNSLKKLEWKISVYSSVSNLLNEECIINKNLEFTLEFIRNNFEIKLNNKHKNRYHNIKRISGIPNSDINTIINRVKSELKVLRNENFINKVESKLYNNNYRIKLESELQEQIKNNNYSIGCEVNGYNSEVIFYLYYKNIIINSIEMSFECFNSTNITKLKKSVIPKFKEICNEVVIKNKHTEIYYGLELNKWRLTSSNYDIALNVRDNELNMCLYDYEKAVSYPISILKNEMITVNHVELIKSDELNRDEFHCEIEKFIITVLGIKCCDCNQMFKLSNSEYKFFIDKGFDLPKRCKSCRQKRKLNNQKG